MTVERSRRHLAGARKSSLVAFPASAATMPHRLWGRMTRTAFRDGDVISGGLLAALGLYIVLEARGWTYSGPEGPGPGFFPIWYGILMIGLSLFMIVTKLMRSYDGDGIAYDWRAIGRSLSTWLAFALAVALLKPLGFLVSFALLTFFIVAVVFRRSLVTAAVTAVAVTAAFQLTFPIALGVALPVGPLGF
jgi:putative tricarboxylic transport membrane protein